MRQFRVLIHLKIFSIDRSGIEKRLSVVFLSKLNVFKSDNDVLSLKVETWSFSLLADKAISSFRTNSVNMF